jgi:sulfite reductase beta subunit-like hemoprotein
MKYLVKKLGETSFVELIEEEFARVERERGAALREELAESITAYRPPTPVLPPGGAAAAGDPETAHWIRTNTRPQRQPGYRMAIVAVPLGDLTGQQLRGLAGLVRRLGNGTLRLTNEQNALVPWIPEGCLAELHRELCAFELGEANALHLTDVVSCPGMDYCSLAMTRSMGVAERIRRALLAQNGTIELTGDLRVKISGCPNACGQHHVGDIGLTGVLSKDEDGIERPHYSILVGGGVGETTGRLGQRLDGRYPEDVAPVAVSAVARLYVREREPGERFGAFVERVGVDRLSAAATEAAAAREDR